MPTSYSLHVGVDDYDTQVYLQSVNRLNGCLNDMRAMATMADRMGVPRQNTLSLPNAIKRQVVDGLEWMADRTQPGDFFLFTFAGHGMEHPTRNAWQDPDGVNESICLRDDILLDDDVHHLLGKFKDMVRIVCLFDSCHSGSVIKLNYHTTSVERKKAAMDTLAWLDVATPRALTREEEAYTIQKLFGDNLPTPTARQLYLNAIGISLAACGEGSGEVAYEVDGRGLFSKAMEDAFYTIGTRGTYARYLQHTTNWLATHSSKRQRPTSLSFRSRHAAQNNEFIHESPAFDPAWRSNALA